jgi:outer membrane protein assembly factor BamB
MTTRLASRFSAALLLSLLAQALPAFAAGTARPAGWYQWRGPEENGVSRETGLPDTWDPDTGENVIWSAPVGGMSSPVVWNGKLYTWTRVGEVPTGAADYPTLAPGPKTQEALTCVDIKTGKVLWQHLNNMTQTEVPFHRLGWSSPCVDPETGRVYALGSQCWFLCLDGETGKVIWQRQMTEEFGLISTFGGRTPAPSIDEDQVFLCGVAFGWGDQARGQHRIYSFNKATGELNWVNSTGGIPVDAPQNTPVVAVIKGQRLVIFAAGDGTVAAFQARTGKKVWTKKVSKRGLNTSVVVDGERLYCSHGLDNLDTSALGRLFCLDLANLDEKHEPKELWKITGIEAAFPTPAVTDKWAYFVDDRCRLYQVDKMTGKLAWKQSIGRVGKPSPVFADGKVYVADGDGRFAIVKPGDKSAKVLSKVELTEKLGREYVIYGSPAIADGRIYLQAATKLYCIGLKDHKAEKIEIPPMPEETPAQQGKPAQLVVVPADAALHAGDSVKFHVRSYDANGQALAEVPADQVKWSVAQLTIPAPPPRPKMPMPESAKPPQANSAGGEPKHEGKDDKAVGGATGTTTGVEGAKAKGESSDDARKQLAAAAAAQPAAAPTKAGNLMGEVAPDGTFKGQAGPHQAGAVEAKVGDAVGQARVRVFPPLPWKFDFDKAPLAKPPLTWLGAGGKYAVVEDPDKKENHVLQKLMDIDLYYRARTNFGMPDMSDYTVQADAKVNEKTSGDRKYMPSAAVINSRYVLVLDGMRQVLQIHIWPSALPDERNPSGSQQRTIDFPFEAKKWYRLKLQVTQEGDKAVARGKAWPADGAEPKDWMLTLNDPIPNREGNPGLFSVSLVGAIKSEVYYDNILVTPNKSAATSSAAK